MAEYLGPIQDDAKIGQVLGVVLEPNEIPAGVIEETTQDGKARLRVRLAPLSRSRVVELERGESGPCHLQVGHVQDRASLTGHVVTLTVAKAKDLEDVIIARERHGHTFGSTFLVAGRDAAKDRPPRLTGLVPRRDGLLGDGAHRGVVHVKVVHTG